MNKTACQLTALLFISLFTLLANPSSAQNGVLKINPLSLVGADLDISYERVITPQRSVCIGLYTGTAKPDAVQHFNIGLSGEYRQYITIGNLQSSAPQGLYVAPFARLRYGSADGGHMSYTNLGVVGGHQWIIRERFTAEAFAGPYYNLILSEKGEVNTDAVRYYGKTSFRLGINLGYRL
jgi:hypothetical protein